MRQVLRLPFSPRHLALLPISLVMLLPLVWMLITSIQTLPETRHFPPHLIPSGIHWRNYPDALNSAPFGRFFLNSFIVTGASVVGNLVFCSLAGYAFARLRFFGRDVLFVVLLATLMVPFQVVMIPTFLIVQRSRPGQQPGGADPAQPCDPVRHLLAAPVLPHAADRARGGGAHRRLLAAGRAVPGRAAAVDAGAGDTGHRHLPVDVERLLWPLIVITSTDQSTVQLGLASFQGAHQTNWPQLMAGNVTALAPMLIVFVVAQRWFVRVAGVEWREGLRPATWPTCSSTT